MAKRLQVTAALKTDPGQIRGHNEDSVGRYEPTDGARRPSRPAIYMVADGVGGAEAGEIASHYATERIVANYLTLDPATPTGERLRRAMQQTNDDVRALSAESYDGRHMATTAVVAVVEDSQVTIGNVGDSRAYHWRDGTLRQITRDHSLVAQLLEEGAISAEEALTHPRRNVILYSLGSAREPKIDLFTLSAEPDDIVLLCSDGLTRHVSDDELAGLLNSAEPDQVTQQLIDLANERGGHDNISVGILRFTPVTTLARVISGVNGRSRASLGLRLYTAFLAVVEAILILAVYYALRV